MARKSDRAEQHTGLYYAREARRMSRTELVRRSGVSKQQLSRLENGLIRLRLDHLKPFANALDYTPEQILLWGRYPGTGGPIKSSDVPREEAGRGAPFGPAPGQMPELDPRAKRGSGGTREVRKDGRYEDPIKPEGWFFPEGFVREQLHSAPARLLVLDTTGDSMTPTIAPGDRVIVDTGHKTPSPDGLYAIRDTLPQYRGQAPAIAAGLAPDAGEDHLRQCESSERRSCAQRTGNRRQGPLLPEVILSARRRPIEAPRRLPPRRSQPRDIPSILGH